MLMPIPKAMLYRQDPSAKRYELDYLLICYFFKYEYSIDHCFVILIRFNNLINNWNYLCFDT